MTLVTRAKNMIVTPKTEWPIIAAEPADIIGLYKGYILPLAAIGPICGFIGMTSGMGRYGLSGGFALRIYLTLYISNLIGVFVFGLVISKLAPRFGGAEDLTGGIKIAAYAATASWVGGIFLLLPILRLISTLLALYSLYLFFIGLPVVMRTPDSNSLPYAGLSIVVVIVLYLIFYTVQAVLVPAPAYF